MTHLRMHAAVVEEREMMLNITLPPGFPIDVALDFELYGDRERAVAAAVKEARRLTNVAVLRSHFSIRQKEAVPAGSKRGRLWRFVCGCEGSAPLKPSLEERAEGEPEQVRRQTASRRSKCPFAVYFEETDTHITLKGSPQTDMTVHNHDLLLMPTAKAAFGSMHDEPPRAIIEEAREMQNTMRPRPLVATIAKFLIDRESARAERAGGKRKVWTVKQFQNELAPDPASMWTRTTQSIRW